MRIIIYHFQRETKKIENTNNNKINVKIGAKNLSLRALFPLMT